jgi:hypothetical protein
MHVAAASEAAVLLGVPAKLPAAALQPVWPAVLVSFFIIDVEVALQA